MPQSSVINQLLVKCLFAVPFKMVTVTDSKALGMHMRDARREADFSMIRCGVALVVSHESWVVNSTSALYLCISVERPLNIQLAY